MEVGGEGDSIHLSLHCHRMIPALRWAAMRAILMFQQEVMDAESRFAVGWKDLGSIPLRFSFLFNLKIVVCGHCLVTVVSHNYWNIKMALSAAHLNAGHSGGDECSDRNILSLFPHLHTPFPPFSPSLISLMVSVDVKHHVYLLTWWTKSQDSVHKRHNLF